MLKTKSPKRCCSIIVALLCMTPSVLSGQDKTAATINDTVIRWASIQNDVKRIVGTKNIEPQRLKRLEQSALETRIKQHVVFDFLKERNLAADKSEIRVEVESLKSELAKIEKTLEDQLKESNQTMTELEFQLNWRISWSRYLKKKLTSSFLESHYNKNARRFDGTQLRVAHLLLKCNEPVESEAMQKATAKIELLREQLASKNLDWKTATAQSSEAPTKDSNGEIGWIKITGPMPESFTKMAFALNKDEVSQPAITSFGVHLIKCLEVDKGSLGWRDAKDAVKKDAERELLEAIVNEQRPKLKITIGKQ